VDSSFQLFEFARKVAFEADRDFSIHWWAEISQTHKIDKLSFYSAKEISGAHMKDADHQFDAAAANRS
jgi:hypothetical protein